jgi:hypothetical protein
MPILCFVITFPLPSISLVRPIDAYIEDTDCASGAQRLQLAPASLAKILERIVTGYLVQILPQLIERPVGRSISFHHMKDHLLGEPISNPRV